MNLREKNKDIYLKAQKRLKDLGIDISLDTIYRVDVNKCTWLREQFENPEYPVILDNLFGVFKILPSKMNSYIEALTGNPEKDEDLKLYKKILETIKKYKNVYKKNVSATTNGNDL